MKQALSTLEGWKGSRAMITKTYRFRSFNAAMNFMRRCASGIDLLNHHPQWTNVYDRVEVTLTTHDAGNKVTAKDIQLAKLLDRAAQHHER